MSQKKLVLFDLDGVILNSKMNMEYSWGQVCSQLKINVDFEEYFSKIGRPFFDIMTMLGLQEYASRAESIFRVSSMSSLHLVSFYDGVRETLSALEQAGIGMGVVTSKDRMRTNAILAMLPVDFTTVQTPGDKFRGKPAPDHLLLAMAESQIDPADTIYIGDMDSDFEAAQRAGIDYLHAQWGYGAAPKDGIPALSSIKELADWIGVRHP
ncbi:HAD family hydrolase [Magnetospirillum sulfuroxidans]|uniref:phosphoglycolate phosphatase n=1 Tax=Magnetospirillum sulfuroxidans TaxID=611300 RepID=A0ABS5IH20_9PROT|nr:HAD-IA family hydrolase [Magnetospirillum sulfuroxidans]MBR9973689.1 HAD-IA family hydrolase [Magnetospirillum sulfuroxidans]